MRLILDTDIGNAIAGANTDDGLALALILSSKEIKLEMLSTVCGNVPSLVAYSVAKDLFKRLNLNIPVYLGANEALKEPSKAWLKDLMKVLKILNLNIFGKI